jgi:hypothetical protein
MGARTALSRRRKKGRDRRPFSLDLTFEDIMADLDPGWLARSQEATEQRERNVHGNTHQ